jgi:putative monooxygenase
VAAVPITKVAVGDVVPNRRRGGELRVVLGPKTAGATTGFLGVVTLQPGEFVAEHYHPYSEEFLYAIRGTMVVRVDGQSVTLHAGEGVVIPKNARHRSQNDGDEVTEAVFHLCPLAPRPELGHVDTEEVPNADAPQLVVGEVPA